MTEGRRVLCVTGDPDVAERVRMVLDDAVPDTTVTAVEPAAIEDPGGYAVAVVTDVGVGDPCDVVRSLRDAAPTLPLMLASRADDGALTSDALDAGAEAYAPLDDKARLKDRLEGTITSGPHVARFEHLVEHVGVAVGAYGRDGVISYANPAYADLLGVTPAALHGTPVWEINPRLSETRFEQYFDSFAPGETRHSDARHRRTDGTIVPVHTATTMVQVEDVPLHVGTITDITDRLTTKHKIEALHEVANALAEPDSAESIHDLVVDAAERILDLHSCYFLARDEDNFTISAHSADAVIDIDQVPEGRGVIWRTYADQEPILVEDAQTHPVARPTSDMFRSAISVPVGTHGVFQAASAEVGAFTREDLELADLLTTHAAAALDRVNFASAIRNERDRLGALFENVPSPVIEYEMAADGSAIATDVNPAFEAVFGYTATEYVGSDIDETIVLPEDRARAETFNEDLLAGRNITGEVQRVTADGARDFMLDVVPLEVDAENGAGYAIYTDITDQKERERQLARQNDRLEEFASVVSHDLRNPLNVATGRLELARETANEETAAHVAEAQTALDRMDRLIADLLWLAREGRAVGDAEPVDLECLADEAWSTVQTGEATLVVEDVPTVQADGDRVRQLLENLFANSIEHGGDGVTVTVAGTEDGFAVFDDGVGIPEDTHGRVLRSGYTTNADGTGFGLAIVERIAGAHGWAVAVSDAETGGARFDFQLSDGE